MQSRRSSERIASTKKCMLDYHGKVMRCQLEDISASGVRVNCREAAQEELKRGEVCSLRFDDPQLNRRKFRCSVSRQDASHVGLQFVFLD